MELVIAIASVLLVALTFLSLVDTAFGELSDVGLRRMIGDAEEGEATPGAAFLAEILENRTRFRHTLTVAILVTVVAVSFLIFYAVYRSRAGENSPPRV